MQPLVRARRRRSPARWVALAILSALVVAALLAPRWVDARLNRVEAGVPRTVSERARRLHAELFVADLHADTLLWDRPFLTAIDRGAVDLPRLITGNVALQAFAAVTQAPGGGEFHRSAEAFDRMTPLVACARWPPRTWQSPLERALYQAAKLRGFADRSGGRLVPLWTQADLSRLAASRSASANKPVGALLAAEGLQCLEGRLGNLEVLKAAGFRMLGLAHLADNEVGGSRHGARQGGLTALGRSVVPRAEQLGLVLDLAHSSKAVFADVLALASRPVVVSHTGVRGVVDSPRNLSDRELEEVAAHGGIVGIGAWATAIGELTPEAMARSIRYAADRVGVDHVALGSDFDGGVATGFDAGGWAEVTDALLVAGFSEREVAQIMGGNVRRLLSGLLPP